MRYSTFFKFIAIVLCAASLLGMAGSAAGIIALTELGNRSVSDRYEDQLQNRAIAYAQNAGNLYLSEHLGNAPRNLINRYWGNDWENSYFDWSRSGYILRDPQGEILTEKPVPSGSQAPVFEKEFPVSGQYIRLISTAPVEEATADPSLSTPEVPVMPAQGTTSVYAIIADYTDGSREEWHYDGTQLGSLEYTGGNTVTFLSNVGDLPMGDGWYPNHILFADRGGNIVYEAFDDTMVILGSSLKEDGLIRWLLPAASITAVAPVGTTLTAGDFTAYDAIPEQGTTVTSMNVTYANAQGEVIGSEGISSPEFIGTLYHTRAGNAEFRSREPMQLDIPEDCIITQITFADLLQNCIFEASCPSGTGTVWQDTNGTLLFRSQIPGLEEPVDSVPEESLPAAEPTEVLSEGWIGTVLTEADVYTMPSTRGKVVTTLMPGQDVVILTQVPFSTGSAGSAWGMLEEGWVLMDHIAVSHALPTATPPAEPQPEPRIQAPEPTAAPEVPPETHPAETVPAETLPAESAAPTAVNAADIRTARYYDSEQGREMIAEYVMETVPGGYTVTVQLAAGALRDELSWTLLRLAETFRHILLELLGICIAVFALCVVHLSCSAGRTRRNNDVRAGGLNRIPLDLYLVGGGFGVTGLVAAAVYGSEYFAQNDQQLAILCCGACAYLASLLLVAFFFACVAQFKTPGGYWWRNTLCGRCLRLLVRCGRSLSKLCKKWVTDGLPLSRRFFRWLRRFFVGLWDTALRLLRWAWNLFGKCIHWFSGHLARFFSMLPITWQFLTTGFTLVFLLYVMMRTYKVGYILLGFGIFFAVILYAASAFAILLESAKRMSRGDLDTKVNERMLIGGFREFAEKLNDLAGVAVIAAQKQLKSERMKTELITNVSHDIKTPLTSIINYVDLLQKPHTEAQQEQYLEVLDRQSQRLKKLIDDLMEMSKASTGNIAVDIETVDAGEAVNQALGEFADKLEKAQLIPVFRQPDDPVYMLADGKLVWRVMSNLLGNAVKYALPGTRIYLDLMELDGKVILSMKNISREELNVHADELMERFVRGDASRNTEGSGLGLNITQSLMALQKGQLQILVDGDLFKVTLIFPAA